MILFKEYKDILTKLAIFSLVVLFFIEVFGNYDVLQRRLALATTDIFVIIVYTLIYRKLKNKYQIILPGYIALVAAFGVWLDAAGNFAHFYFDLAWWDDFTHFIGSVAVATALFYVFYHLNKKGFIKLGRFNLNLFTVAVSMLLVVLYEISEFIGDLLFDTQRVGLHYDTASDLTYNLLGVLLVIVIGNILVRGYKDNQ